MPFYFAAKELWRQAIV
ncbi:hypothetical protein [Xanthomonas oryzae]|nr:hypothetical protein [Xanthomonas oryzae]UWI58792.1 hypothetical protein NO430_14315 [Xanthomonas oryzae pv. oryzae]